jgi:hypothetical protein
MSSLPALRQSSSAATSCAFGRSERSAASRTSTAVSSDTLGPRVAPSARDRRADSALSTAAINDTSAVHIVPASASTAPV